MKAKMDGWKKFMENRFSTPFFGVGGTYKTFCHFFAASLSLSLSHVKRQCY